MADNKNRIQWLTRRGTTQGVPFRVRKNKNNIHPIFSPRNAKFCPRTGQLYWTENHLIVKISPVNDSNQHCIHKSCIVNRKNWVGDSKYAAVFDPYSQVA